ncbi:MAG: hypothetical protein KDM64_16735, partial [Verrucomicrobiae bacterium]|nr:hypothetical protein [Verrucomicrobiae bacterium]
GAHRWKLFHLSEDLGEKTDLASQEPEKVRELDALIDGFLADTGAVVPIPNPAFNPAAYYPENEGKPVPKTKPAAKKADPGDDPKLQGWKARGCKATVKEGILTVTATSDAPFLGVAPGAAGPGSITFRVRAGVGGAGKIEWIPSGQKAQSVPFTLKGGEWESPEVSIPAAGPLGILRIYLPAKDRPVELDWVHLISAKGKKAWEF